ncbi:MAG: aromatic ring-hydroxylating dioxygenase subunit alpha [bacterium]|nr:aromatic ring-hydroxylating dioxygenase subunit alpha [bacterium]MDE0289617.1 aromatic ring-hydroxylating dioxygenase subunit alpha [bacterium]MDE0440433.1 aromatic ring-hydroxylating dioxygenase subunit alpha [bacterium]
MNETKPHPGVHPAPRDYWYPVAMSSEVTDKPVGTSLHGERLAVVRLEGEPVVYQDLCIHRGSPLSMGWVEGPRLTCGYHGWQYDRSGACVRIPQRDPSAPIPSKARVPIYPTIERFGVIWATLGNPVNGPGPMPEWDDPACRTIFLPPFEWQASAGRMMENFLDAGHFAWVHTGLLGDPERPMVYTGPVTHDDEGFSYVVETDIRDETAEGGWVREGIFYRFTLPFWFMITEAGFRPTEKVFHGDEEQPDEGETSGAHYRFDIVLQPMAQTRTRRYTWITRNYDLDPESDEKYRSTQYTVAMQDQPIVEAQRPEELPLDITAELHIKGVDAPAIALRKLLAERGLGASALAP